LTLYPVFPRTTPAAGTPRGTSAYTPPCLLLTRSPYDNLSAKQCHQKALPCNVNNTDICISQADTETIYRLGHYEYAYRWRGAENSTLYSVLKMGPWFSELRSHLLDAAEGSRKIKYLHK
jgi:acid phosphatase